MSEQIIVVVGFLILTTVAGIVVICNKVQEYQNDKDFDNVSDELIDKIKHNSIKYNEALKDFGTSTKEASSRFSELAKALDSPIITPNEARKLIGISIYAPQEDMEPIERAKEITKNIYEGPFDDECTIEYTGRYRCPACGTMYIHEGGGFIPNCKNCGSQLVEQMMIEKEE